MEREERHVRKGRGEKESRTKGRRIEKKVKQRKEEEKKGTNPFY